MEYLLKFYQNFGLNLQYTRTKYRKYITFNTSKKPDEVVLAQLLEQ